MTDRLERTSVNIRKVVARIYPEVSPERLVPAAISDLFADPVDLASALFAPLVADGVSAVPAESRAGSVARLAPPAQFDNPQFRNPQSHFAVPRQGQRRDWTGAARLARAREPFFEPGASVFDDGRESRASRSTKRARPGDDGIRGGAEEGVKKRTLNAETASFDRPVLSDELTLRPFESLGVAPSSVEGRQAQGERQVEGLTMNRPLMVSLSNHAASTFERDVFTASEAVPDGSSDRFTRSLAPERDDGVTRWVRGAAGLASLLAPSGPLATGATTTSPPLPPWHHADAHRPDPSGAIAPVIRDAPAPPARAVTPDIESIFDELERRLELEYLRHYGTSGR